MRPETNPRGRRLPLARRSSSGAARSFRPFASSAPQGHSVGDLWLWLARTRRVLLLRNEFVAAAAAGGIHRLSGQVRRIIAEQCSKATCCGSKVHSTSAIVVRGPIASRRPVRAMQMGAPGRRGAAPTSVRLHCGCAPIGVRASKLEAHAHKAAGGENQSHPISRERCRR